MHYYLTLLFLLGIQLCMATPYPSDTVAIIQRYIARANQYKSNGAYELAIQEYESVKAELVKQQDDVYLVYVLNQLASLYSSDSATWKEAQAYLDTAELILEKKLYENDTLRIHSWITIAELNFAQRKFNTAIEYYQKVLERRKAMFGETHLKIADLYSKIGEIYLYDLQNPFTAKTYYEEFIKIREDLNELGRHYINGYYSLASANRQQGDYEKALAYGHLVKQGYDSLEDVNAFDLVISNSLLANIYYDIDSIAKALNYNRNAITSATIGQFSPKHVTTVLYANQARFYFRADNYDSTIYYANLALNDHASQDIRGKAYQFLGNAYWKKNMLDKAFHFYQKSRRVKEGLYGNQHTQLATLYVDIARAYATTEQTDSAFLYFQKGLSNAKISEDEESNQLDSSIQAGDDLETIQEALDGVTNLLYDAYQRGDEQKHLEKSLPYYQLFDRFMDLSRTNFSSEGSKLILSGNFKTTYEKALATCYALYETNHSDSLLDCIFRFMEKSKAMVLLESIHKGKRYQSILPDSLIVKENALRAQLAFINKEIADIEKKESELLSISDLQTQKAGVLRELEELNQHIRSNYPNFYQLTNRESTVDIDSLQSRISESQSLLSYYWGDSSVYVLMISKDTVLLHQIDDLTSLQNDISKYMDVLINDDIHAASYTNFQKYQESAHALYQLLLEPLLKKNSTEHLVIVPDGALTTIPFESLIKSKIKSQKGLVSYEKLHYLLNDYEISYEFSASITFWEERYAKSSAEEDNFSVVAFGIKDFESIQGSFPPLGGAEREVLFLKEKFPEASVFLNHDATEKKFKQNAPHAEILHIATHGIANMENPFASHLIFFPEEKEDGTFNLYELYDLRLHTKLLLLSACESGVGKHFAGEGNFSMARSFVYAGCQSVLMSLWQVDDFQTEQLIYKVYEHLAQEPTVSKVIRKAKLDLIQGGTFSHPQIWAGMVPLGNANITYNDKSYQLYYIMGGISFSLLMIFFIVKRYK
ncbi:CHAT domain-containing protein [Catalinimonas sp. 4WD22]|uniref:CHAT domain-containing protein n=1 Tax=Catalinimonas locisalis TaxID=3133978 RepID=UPI003100E2E1